jgi:drug/metabolite transporter (DMT)-like permease
MRFTSISSLLIGSFVPSVSAFTGPSSINHMRSIQHEATLFHRSYASPMTLNVASREVSNSFLPEGVFKGATGKSRFDDASIQKSDSTSDAEYTRGLFTIGFITFLFSSNSPCLHAAFVNASSPPPVLLLNAATSTIALMGLVTFGPILNALVPLPTTLESEETDMMTNMIAGTELGLWKTLGTTANLYGLSMTTANHAAFLIQLTTLIVPAYQGLTGVPIPNRIWTAIGLALAGITMFTQDAAAGGGDIMNNSSLMGDALCALAAVFYATYDLRLFDLGKKVPPLPLIRTKIAVQAVLSCALLAFANEGGLSSAMDYMHDLIANPNDAVLIGSAALWSGLAINAIAPFMQVSGQQTVGASRAQVLYASQPLWASFLSYFLLNETLSEDGMKGGSLFLIAIFFAATAESPEPDCEEKTCEV